MRLEDVLCDRCLTRLEQRDELHDLALGAPLNEEGLCDRCVRRIRDWRAAQERIGELWKDIPDTDAE